MEFGEEEEDVGEAKRNNLQGKEARKEGRKEGRIGELRKDLRLGRKE